MSTSRPLTCRRIRSSKRWSIATMIAMIASMVSPALVPTVQAQTAPVGAGFTLDAHDLRFIFHAIEVAQEHSVTRTAANPCGTLLGPGPNQVNLFGVANPQLPLGLRTVDGSCNNLVPNQQLFGASDQLFPRLTVPNFRTAEAGTSYVQLSGDVVDSQPRIISNLIFDQTAANPAAVAAAANVCGAGGFVCSGAGAPDSSVPAFTGFPATFDTGSIFIQNTTPDFGLSAPFNLVFTFFGQFFDHGLDLVNKGGNGTVLMPLQPDDPLFRTGVDPAFNTMTMPRASVDANHNAINQTTPWVDQNQTYTSHPSHQVFLRQYQMVGGRPVQDGKMLDGGFCAPRGTGIPGDNICNIGNWGEVKAQAMTKLGINLTDADLFNVPLLLTDPYGHFKPGPNGFPQLVLAAGGTLEGNLTTPVSTAGASRTNHQFLNDVAHSAVPTPGGPDADLVAGGSLDTPSPAGTYDNELLDLHFVTGDGRGNENIALTTMHTIFHSEHNRLVADIDRLINTPPPGYVNPLTAAEIAAWHSVNPGSGWGYGERLFQAARFVTEMQYQHIIFEEFARKIQPKIQAFFNGQTNINPAISAEFAHTVYRLGHSMLPEVINRINRDAVTGIETPNNKKLFDAFLNPAAFNDGGTAGPLSAAMAGGSIVRGLSRQVGNELDEFVTSSVRNTLVGLPLDLPAINIARGRSEGIPSLNSVRRQFFTATRNSAVAPYANWFEFGLNLKHRESLVSFVAAYGTGTACVIPSTTMAAKRAAAAILVAANGACMFAPAATSGLDNVDFWPGGMAERQAAFGGLLGSTFNFVFEQQLTDLQNGDRFYYLNRTDGLNLRAQLESNSLAELVMRNTDVSGVMQHVFETADFNFDMASLTGTAPVDLGFGMQILTTADGTKLFFDPLHSGKNVVFNGTAGNDRMQGDVGDDTFYGNAGNDRIEGNDGNDILVGGDGDDVLFGGNGDDVLKGGPGDDALSGGPGFGGDILLGGDGNDFLLGGDDANTYFGGNGDDIIIDGNGSSDSTGGPGDDWIDGGGGQDDCICGDDGDAFQLLAGVDPVGGDDVLNGGPGQDNAFGQGGDDIFLPNEGTNKFFGDYGFDWITMRGYPLPAEPTNTSGFSVDLGLLAIPGAVLNFNELRNQYRFVDGASGWDFNDSMKGSQRSVLCTTIEVLECLRPNMELTAGTAPVAVPAKGVPGQVNIRGGSGAAKIAGLTELMGPAGFNKDLNAPAIPLIKGVGFMGGNILLGGRGSDVLEGNQGDDLIDGDLWLNVQLRAVLNDGTVKFVDSARDLIDDVFADPQRLNPGNISIIRTIVTPGAPGDPNPAPAPPPDCGAAVPLNCDTAVYHGNLADYDITVNPNGTVTVFDSGRAIGRPLSDGSDTVRNIEQLRFADVTIPTPTVTPNVLVPNVIGLTVAAADAAIVAARLTVGPTGAAFSPTIAIGSVVTQSPDPGTSVAVGTRVLVDPSVGAPVPDVRGMTQAAATTAIISAGLIVGPITLATSTTVPIGNVISQDPNSRLGGFPPPSAFVRGVVIGSSVALVVSSGLPIVAVPNVVGSTQAAATATITGARLTVGAVTTANSTTVSAGNVISQSPVGGTSVTTGSAVDLVVSLGTNAAPILTATVLRNSQGTALLRSPALTSVANSLLVAFVAADADPAGPNTTVTGVTNNGVVPLTWTRAVGTTAASQLGMAEIWWAYSTSAQTLINVSATLSSVKASSMTVMAFTGADPALIGAGRTIASALTGAPTASLLTTRTNSLVFGVGADFSNGRTMVAGAGQTKINQFVPTVNDTYWVQRVTAPVATAGSTATISDTYAGAMTDQWNLAVIEIRHP